MKAHAPERPKAQHVVVPTTTSAERPRHVEPAAMPAIGHPVMPEVPRADGVLLVDGAAGAHQAQKGDFLARLRTEIHAIAEQELAGTGWTAEHCPYLAYWFDYYQLRSAKQIEDALRKYAPATAETASAGEYVPAVVARVRGALQRWRATGEIDAPPSVMPLAVEVMTSLGPGTTLDSSVRSRMETAMQTSLADTRVHADSRAASVASEHGARALAIGNHVAFGAGEYAPGTPSGDAMLAHELAHTVQQRGVSSSGMTRALEQDADRSAFGVLAKLWAGVRGAAMPVLRTGMQLQRCRVDQSERRVPAVAETAYPTFADLPEDAGTEQLLESLASTTWKPAGENALLFVLGTQAGSTEKRLFVLPAREYGVQTPSGPSARTNVDPSRRPILAMTASGHSAGHLVNAGGGEGFFVDVFGTPNGRGEPDRLVSQGLHRLAAELGITRIEKALVTHLHSDHAGGLSFLVANNNLRGNQVYAPPGLAGVLAGALAAHTAALANSGNPLFPQNWRPQALSTRQLDFNRSVTEATLEVGNARLVMVVETANVEAFLRALATGGWEKAKSKADAATPLTRVIWESGVEAVITGDKRGRTIEDLYHALGDSAFRSYIGNARILIGLHHIGTGLQGKDLRGFNRILTAMGSGKQPITVLAQTGEPHAVNERFIEGLNLGGVRVVFLEDVDPNKPNAEIKVRSGGTIVGKGAQERGIHPDTRAAQERLANMEAAVTTLERLSDFRGVEGATRQQIIDGLKAEIARLTRLLEARLEIGLRDVHRAQNTEQRDRDLAANTNAIKRVEGMEKTAGTAVIDRLVKGHAQLNELTRELNASRVGASTSPRLRQLLARIDPWAAQQILIDELGKPMSRNQQRKAWRRVQSLLEKQVRTAGMIRETHQVGARAKGAALFGLALQLWELAEPGVEAYFESKNDRAHEDFYMFFRDAIWWYEKGIHIPVSGETEDGAPPSLDASIERRIHDDGPTKKTMSPEATSAKPLERLWVPELNTWSEAARRAFFDTLRTWLSAHINDLEDYFAELKTGIAAPIRIKNNELPTGDQTWQIHVGVLSGGHVHGAWQDSDELTRIMNQTVIRAMVGTELKIEERVEKSKTKLGTPLSTVKSADDKTTTYSQSDAVTGRLVVTAKTAKLYGVRNNTPVELDKVARRDTGLQLLELGDRGAPSGYVWVTAADPESYYLLRGLTGWHYVESIQLPRYHQNRNPNSPDFEPTYKDVPSKYMNERELAAWTAYKNDIEGYYFVEDKSSNVYRGTISIYERGPNIGAMVLMRRSDLGPA